MIRTASRFSKLLMVFVLAGIGQSYAQQKTDSVFKDQTIEIIQSYKPEIKETPKPDFSIDLPPKDTTTPYFQYNIPQQVLSYSYTAPPLKPLSYTPDSSILPYPNYIKLGGGNLSTLYLDAGVGSLSGKNYTTSLHLHHLQQKGDLPNQQTAFSGLNASGNYLSNSLKYEAVVELLRNKYALYGGFHDTGTAAPQNVYAGGFVKIGVHNIYENILDINFHPTVKMGIYGRENITEKSFGLQVPVTKKLNREFTAAATANVFLASLSRKGLGNNSSNMLQIIPEIIYHKDGFTARAGMKPTLGKNNNYILPGIHLKYQFSNIPFQVFAGWDGNLIQNSFYELSTYNPYLTRNYFIQQTKTTDVFGGLQVGAGNNLHVTLKAGHRSYVNLPMMVNSFAPLNDFFITYDSEVKAAVFNATAGYDIADIFSLKLSGIYLNFYEYTYARVWHIPALRFNADFKFKPFKDLYITAYSSVLDGTYAKNEFQVEEKLKAAFELGIGGEYHIIPRLSAFINMNNLLNNKYERWYLYQAYGFNIFGGLRLKY